MFEESWLLEQREKDKINTRNPIDLNDNTVDGISKRAEAYAMAQAKKIAEKLGRTKNLTELNKLVKSLLKEIEE